MVSQTLLQGGKWAKKKAQIYLSIISICIKIILL